MVPGFAALGLGLLYATGAVIKAGQLRGEGLNVRDTLPLVPLEQILALGIGTLVTSLIWVVVFAALVWLYIGWKPPPPQQIHVKQGTFTVLRVSSLVLTAFAVAVWFYAVPFFAAIGTSAAIFLGSTIDRWRPRGRRYVVYILVGYFVIVLAARTGGAYFSPEPLPHVTLRLGRQPNTTEGTLIVARATPGT